MAATATRFCGAVLNSFERQRRDVGEIREQIKCDNDAAADEQRARQCAAGIAHFAAGESDIVPGRLREKRARPSLCLTTSRARASRSRPSRAARLAAIQPFAHGFHHDALRAALVRLQPNDRPTTMSPRSAAVFAKVKMFCTSLPSSKPRVLLQVSSRIIVIATSCSVLKADRVTAAEMNRRDDVIRR